MLNRHGYGTWYFGVRNDGSVTGQEIGDRTLHEISQTILQLKTNDLLKRIGSNKTGYWQTK